MPLYTVFGFYNDGGQRYVEHLSANDPEMVIQCVVDLHPDHSISIVAIVAGEHEDLMEGEYLEDTADRR